MLKISNLYLKNLKNGFHTCPSFCCHSKLTKIVESDGIREIILNDPKTRNAFSMAMMNDILTDLNHNLEDKNLRCIVISSTGSVYSAGHNLKELVPEKSFEFHQNIFAKCSELIMSIYKAPVPVIAKVDGLAAAAGCQFVSSCDLLICSDRSSFSTPGANFGIFCSTPGIAVARAIPRIKAAHMLFTGLPISAKDAYIAGLVSSVVPHEELDNEVAKVCCAIKSKSKSVIKLGKEFFYKQIRMGIEDAYKQGEQIMAHNLTLDDGKEGIQSFVEKRKPKWNH